MLGKKQKRPKGFSLIEVMVALGILSVGLLALVTLVSTSDQMMTAGSQGSRIAYFAQMKADALQSVRPFPEKGSDVVEGGIQRTWEVIAPKPPSRLWQITVKVIPPDPREKSFTLKKLAFY